MTEEELRDKIRKITMLYERASTEGERQAAAAALARLRQAHGEPGPERVYPNPFTGFKPPPKAEVYLKEMQFSIADPWARRLFVALCRRHGLRPFRYKRQRKTTLMLRVDPLFLDTVLWPEYEELRELLSRYLEEATTRIIQEEVFGEDYEEEG